MGSDSRMDNSMQNEKIMDEWLVSMVAEIIAMKANIVTESDDMQYVENCRCLAEEINALHRRVESKKFKLSAIDIQLTSLRARRNGCHAFPMNIDMGVESTVLTIQIKALEKLREEVIKI